MASYDFATADPLPGPDAVADAKRALREQILAYARGALARAKMADLLDDLLALAEESVSEQETSRIVSSAAGTGLAGDRRAVVTCHGDGTAGVTGATVPTQREIDAGLLDATVPLDQYLRNLGCGDGLPDR